MIRGVIFGDSVDGASSAAPSHWIAPTLRGAVGTVGSLVPNVYAAFLRVYAPPPSEEWWRAYRDLFASVAEVGGRHTARPDAAWFAVWEGHGFDAVSSRIAWPEPPTDDAERRAREAERARLRDDDRRRNDAIRSGLDELPQFDLPHRTYHLLAGHVAAVVGLRDPAAASWRNPDLFWPDDRRWFVATDVDFWSLYIGGDDDFITDLGRVVPTPTERIALSSRLETEI